LFQLLLAEDWTVVDDVKIGHVHVEERDRSLNWLPTSCSCSSEPSLRKIDALVIRPLARQVKLRRIGRGS
jgi:hypothetical protein